MIRRAISPLIERSKPSILLLGPRQTGKSTLVKGMKRDLTINLADQETYLEHTQDFGLLRNLIDRKNARKIFIDEVQRVPDILNTVQALIDEGNGLKFYLTGSSARKLKRGGANLLPGRVVNFVLGTLTLREVGYKIRAEDLAFGFLPGVYTENDVATRKNILTSYGANYLAEEIKAEALVRDLPSFTRFLDRAVETVGQFVDYSKLAKQAKISRHQVPRYFEIYEDTMVGYRIFPDPKLIEKYDLVKHPKFFLFDVGVYNGLAKSFEQAHERRGVLCEQFVFQQLMHSASAARRELKIHSMRTRGGAEIDFWLKLETGKVGLEVKSSDLIIEDDVRHLAHFKALEPSAQYYLAHFGKSELKRNGIWCLPVAQVFRELGL